MVFEDVNYGQREAVNPELSSKLFESGYSKLVAATGLNNSDNRATLCAADAKETPPAKEQIEKPPAKESTETPEQKLDNKIKERFGADVFDHLKDRKWLAENREKLEAGFQAAPKLECWNMAERMRDLSKVDGKSLIFISRTEGQSRGNLLEKRYDIYLRGGTWSSDAKIGQVYH